MEELLCACGGKLTLMTKQEAKDENTGEDMTVGVYECEDCGGIFFYREKSDK